MSRARRAGSVAPPFALVLAIVVASLATVAQHPAPTIAAAEPAAAVVAWPTSTLVVSEVMTGGVSASDEFVELANTGPLAVDLVGLEIVYATSTGSTVTRKVAWAISRILDPGRHLLVANAAGIHAPMADATYSGGLSATGGAVVLRVIGGLPVDAVAWGDATNAFVEGSTFPAPMAGSSVERRPGGALGNGTDSNDNLADFSIAIPNPQNLGADPAPDPGVVPGPSQSPIPTPLPSEAVPTPTATPIATPTTVPSAIPTQSPIPTPMPSEAVPTPTRTPVPTPSAAPVLTMSIADARTQPDGTIVRVAGTLTTDLGALDAARVGFLQDATGGIALRLDAAFANVLAVGSSIAVEGVVGSYFSLRVVNVAGSTIEVVGRQPIPEALGITTGAATESLEGLRLAVSGTISETPSALADGLGVMVDDGSGPLRLVVSAAAQGGQPLVTGDVVSVRGPLGQRDSSGSGSAWYRLHVTQPGELAVTAPPTPSPTPTPSAPPSPLTSAPPSPTPTPTPASSMSPAPTGGASPSTAPSSTPSGSPSAAVAIDLARRAPVTTRLTVRGVVTAESRRLGAPPLIAIQDATAGICVRLADDTPRPAAGTWIEVTGSLADPFGQLEIRAVEDFRVLGTAAFPEAVSVDGATLGEAVEARLVSVDGVAAGRPTKSTSGDLTFVLATATGPVRINADASSGVRTDAVFAGQRARVVGVAGQRASRKGATDGYRVWLRSAADLVRLGSPPSASPSVAPLGAPSAGASPSSPGPAQTIAAAILGGSGSVTIEGTVTVPAALLDSTDRRVVVQDGTAAIEVLLPIRSARPKVGARVRVAGEVGRAYGAPRIRAATVTHVGISIVAPLELRVAPGAAHEWRLVRVRGDVVAVQRSGDRWTAELLVGGTRLPIVGLAGARIPATALARGRTATIVGIVRRPYPGASDRRYALIPRSAGDVTVGGPADDPAESSTGATVATSSPASNRSDGGTGSGTGAVTGSARPLDVDVIALAAHVGTTVRVGGLVAHIGDGAFDLDDGTAVVRVDLRSGSVDVLDAIDVGTALSATGLVVAGPMGGSPSLLVDDAAAIARVGALDAGAGPTAMAGHASSDPSAEATISAAGSGQGANVVAGLADPVIPEIGAAGVILVSLASLSVTVLRRHRMRRRLAARISDRLNAIVGGPSAPAAAALATAGVTSFVVALPDGGAPSRLEHQLSDGAGRR